MLLAAMAAALAITLAPASAQNGAIPAVDAGEFEDSHQNFPPENVIDGDLGTRWASEGDDRNIYVDLGSVHRIDDVAIAWHRGDTQVSEFNIYTRTGTSGSWNEVFSGTSSGDTSGLENYNVDDADARFVRVEVEGNDSGDTFQNIAEIEVYGTGGPPSGDAPQPAQDPDPEPAPTPAPQPTNTDYDIVNSSSANRSNPANLNGGDVDGNLYAFIVPENGIDSVQFFIDGSFVKQEQHPPYDLQGGNGNAQPFNTNQLSNGSHNLAAVITLNNGSTETVSVNFDVDNGGAAPEPDPEPDPEPEEDLDDNIPRNGSFQNVGVGAFEDSRSGHPPENAIDGDLNTRWSSSGEDRDIYVDIGGVAKIDDIGIAWFQGDSRVSEFTIYSRTGVGGNWDEIGSGKSSGESSQIEIYNVDDTDARFVRIEVESNDTNDIQNILEIQVFGPDKVGGSDPGIPSGNTNDDDDNDDDDDDDDGPGEIGPAPTLPTEPPPVNGFGLNPNAPPQDNFDLSRWALDTPAPRSSGSDIGERINENDYDDISSASENFFFTAPDGGMRFVTRIDGARTSSGTSFVRSELREMLRAGDEDISTRGANQNNWALGYQPSGGDYGGRNGVMEASLVINKVTTTGDGDHPGRTIVGQIHAADDEPLKLYYRKNPGDSHGCVYAAAEVRGGDDIRFNLIGDSSCNNVSNGIALNELWSYEIINDDEDIIVRIRRGDDNGPIIAQTTIDMNDYDLGYDVSGEWNYFKAGAYTQNNTGNGSDGDIITFYRLEVSHDNN